MGAVTSEWATRRLVFVRVENTATSSRAPRGGFDGYGAGTGRASRSLGLIYARDLAVAEDTSTRARNACTSAK